MLAIKQWGFILTVVCLASLSFAEDGSMSTQQQCAEYGVYQDASANWIECADSATQQNETDATSDERYIDEPYVEEPYVDDSYVEEPYVEPTYVEESYAE
jgi:hypothetical protein